MKKSKKFNVFNLIILCLVVAIVATIPNLRLLKKGDGLDELNLQNNFIGELSCYQGVINVWNVDTFESGSAPKTDFLEECSLKFSKSHNGLYFLIKNISVEEMINCFLMGQFPDIISFGYGVGNIVKPYLMDLGQDINPQSLNESVLLSGRGEGGEQLALGYLMGGYILASTAEKLTKAGVGSNGTLSTVINNAGYNTTIGKKEKHISSVVVGDNAYVNPCTSMNNFTGLSLTDYYLSKSGYDAYIDFISYNMGTILVGTQRDLFKLSGKIKVGKISDVIIEYLSGFTNLVQYVGVMNNIFEDKLVVAKEFVEFLLEEESQKVSTKIGMVNVIGKNFYDGAEFLSLEQALYKTKLLVPNIFTK